MRCEDWIRLFCKRIRRGCGEFDMSSNDSENCTEMIKALQSMSILSVSQQEQIKGISLAMASIGENNEQWLKKSE